MQFKHIKNEAIKRLVYQFEFKGPFKSRKPKPEAKPEPVAKPAAKPAEGLPEGADKLAPAKAELGRSVTRRATKRRAKSEEGHAEAPQVGASKVEAADTVKGQVENVKVIKEKIPSSFGEAVVNYPKNLDTSKEVMVVHYFPPNVTEKSAEANKAIEDYIDKTRQQHGHANIVFVTSKKLPGTKDKPSTPEDFAKFQERAEKMLKEKFQEELKFHKRIGFLGNFSKKAGQADDLKPTNLNEYFDIEDMGKYFADNGGLRKLDAFDFSNGQEIKERIDTIWQTQIKPEIEKKAPKRRRGGGGGGGYRGGGSDYTPGGPPSTSPPGADVTAGYEGLNESIEQFEGKKVAVFGDSHGEGFIKDLKGLLNPDAFKVQNSKKISYFKGLIENNHDLVKGMDAVFLSMGGNDIAGGASVDTVMTKLAGIVNKIYEICDGAGVKRPKIIISEIYPKRDLEVSMKDPKPTAAQLAENNRQRIIRKATNERIRKGVLPDGAGQFIPFLVTKYIANPSDPSLIHEDFDQDDKPKQQHLNKEGYKLLAGVFAKQFLKPTAASSKLYKDVGSPEVKYAAAQKLPSVDFGVGRRAAAMPMPEGGASTWFKGKRRRRPGMAPGPAPAARPSNNPEITRLQGEIIKSIEKIDPSSYDVVLSLGSGLSFQTNIDRASWAASLAKRNPKAMLIATGGATSKFRSIGTTEAEHQAEVFKEAGIALPKLPASPKADAEQIGDSSRVRLERGATSTYSNISRVLKFLAEAAKRKGKPLNIIIVSDNKSATIKGMHHCERAERTLRKLAKFDIGRVQHYYPPQKEYKRLKAVRRLAAAPAAVAAPRIESARRGEIPQHGKVVFRDRYNTRMARFNRSPGKRYQKQPSLPYRFTYTIHRTADGREFTSAHAGRIGRYAKGIPRGGDTVEAAMREIRFMHENYGTQVVFAYPKKRAHIKEAVKRLAAQGLKIAFKGYYVKWRWKRDLPQIRYEANLLRRGVSTIRHCDAGMHRAPYIHTCAIMEAGMARNLKHAIEISGLEMRTYMSHYQNAFRQILKFAQHKGLLDRESKRYVAARLRELTKRKTYNKRKTHDLIRELEA